jgi:phosphoribosylformylglycinamidine synthase subunit PurS
VNHYRATIRLHPGILDNAGLAVTHALKTMGFETIQDVRMGKILIFDANSLEEADEIAKSQTNEVMETYEVTKCE